MREIEVIDAGVVAYRRMLAIQTYLFDTLVAEKRAGGQVSMEYLILVQHGPVYTLGKHGDKGNMLRQLPGVELVEINRGGDITFHGPGQLVAYPIIDLQAHGLGVKAYVDLLEEAVIRTLEAYGIRGERVEGATGVWLDKGKPTERKICAIGVKCTRFVSMHGLALNVNTDLNYFSAINPCGFVEKGVTSMSRELVGDVDFNEVKDRFKGILLDLLDSRQRK